METNLSNSGTYLSRIHISKDYLFICRLIWQSIVLVSCSVGNGLLITAITRSRKHHNVTNFFIVNLSVSDLIKVVSYVPSDIIYLKDGSWQLGRGACIVFNLGFYVSYSSSVLILMCLTWERYNMVVFPLKKQMSLKTAKVLALLSWFSSLVGAGITTSMYQLVEIPRDGRIICTFAGSKQSFQTLITTGLFVMEIIPLCLFTVAYCRMIRKLRLDSYISPTDISLSSINRAKRNRRAIKILLIEIILFVLCLVPFFWTHLMNAYAGGSGRFVVDPVSFEDLVVFGLMTLFSVVNPIVHLPLSPEFKKEASDLIVGTARKCCCCCEKKRQAAIGVLVK